MNGVTAFGCKVTTPGCLHGLSPAWRAEARGKVGEWRKNEKPAMRLRVGNLQPLTFRPCNVDEVTAEHQQVQIDLARAPTLTLLTAERYLEALQRSQQGEGAGLRVGTSWSIQGNDRVQEIRLIGDANRSSAIQP